MGAIRMDVGRRLLLSGLATMLLPGCQTAPPARDSRVERVAALQRLGFVAADDQWELNLGVKLLFESNVDELSDAGRDAVAGVARGLGSVGIERVIVEGHTDNVGSARHNETLSLRRAQTVALRLVQGGMSDAAIERRGLGFSRPVADNATPEGRAQNRRVVVTVRVD
ncbi:OmpA family protein [Variovorax sp. YR752]|uniref:OmpA family protein n=1 Tax=Variovorax sp. YR752 TaxID=1884383 RepID=UPI003137E3E2